MNLSSKFAAAAIGLIALDIVFNNGAATGWLAQHTLSGLNHVCHAIVNGISSAANSWGVGGGHHVRPH